jgi:glycosyltransferase involved in cell wall biosynthesis
MSLRVALINTFSQGGGAAIACQRLKKALAKQVDYSLISLNQSSFFSKYQWLAKLGLEKWRLKSNLKDPSQKFYFDTNTYGFPIAEFSEIKKADILHLHWINQGFISLEELNKLFATKKPIVWTLHDMWAFTGGCHYSGSCGRYETGCGNCPLLNTNSENDISREQLARKKELFDRYQPQIITCSNWLANCAKNSWALQNCSIKVIPNPIDISIFQPSDKNALRTKLGLPLNKKLLLFSSARLDDPRKGVTYLIKSLNILNQKYPTLKDSLELVFMGALKEPLPALPFKLHTTGFVSGDENLAHYYAACDVFALPSVEDNLPNTVMEAIACGTPAVAFLNGGLEDLIEHKRNGYLAPLENCEDFAEGILYVLNHHDALSIRCREKTVSTFSEEIVAEQYLKVYQKEISKLSLA